MTAIRTLLIANRGEIACRILRTARRMGLRTVAVYSDADTNALHIAMADSAVRIGPAPVGESYLKGEAIIAAAKAASADSIHPGYGFLSENPDFAEAVIAAGLTWVGPPPAAIRAMGLKDAAKRLMEKAGVPVVPGYHGDGQALVLLAGKAREIGYPVLIKARAGGGGKGMRRVEHPDDFAEALAGARREAKSAFGDDRVLVEKYVVSPRHIEVQVFGDAHGNVVHLFERDCSAQRRHQKVIEEAPAPGMSRAVRAAMTSAAVKAAQAIGYQGAGTIEFIADGSGPLDPARFWFMEMNTRLQVEHPVTEMVTGVDLVEWQLRVAAGEKLPLAQDDIRLDGHAFEARLYAEDASRGFLPATGALHHLALPSAAHLRIETGVRPGDTVTPFYDPMIAKIVAHGPDRTTALTRLAEALEETQVAGCTVNAGFLAALARDADFAAGRVDTGLIARKQAALTTIPEPAEAQIASAALAASGLYAGGGGDPWDALAGYAHFGAMARRVEIKRGGDSIVASVRIAGAGEAEVAVGGATFSLPLESRGPISPLAGEMSPKATEGVGAPRASHPPLPCRASPPQGGRMANRHPPSAPPASSPCSCAATPSRLRSPIRWSATRTRGLRPAA
ncbi:MAG: ATP-grasp domain-containing protein [Phyllobacteriaceae bacterium]|nr:ATP-grasp domain-containing protein [Phyllobacteriaceae bacterium]